jgi:glycosyltransferase involved in cell wall biosynthesis
MLLSNGFAPDPRVAAEALALSESGYQITIFAWDRTGQLPEYENYQGIEIVRCRINTTYSRGPLQIFKFRQFWTAAVGFLQQRRPEIIHCHDLDTLRPGISYGRKFGIPVIFDAHESYPDMVAHLFPSWLTFMIRRMEAALVPKTAAVITVGEILARHYHEFHAKRVVVVGNYKTLTLTQPVIPPEVPPLKIIYVGGLNRDRMIGPMIQAISGDQRYHFTIVGEGSELQRLQQLAGSSTNIVFTGYKPQSEARAFIEQCHLVYYGIDCTYKNNQYSTPNLLFLALASGRPMITTNVGEIAEIVRIQRCGSVLASLEVPAIRQTLEKYFDCNLWQPESERSFQAATLKYNWGIAKQNLIGLYHDLEL